MLLHSKSKRKLIHIVVLLILFLVAIVHSSENVVDTQAPTSSGENSTSEVDDQEIEHEKEEEEVEPAYAVLFPCFTLTVGVVIFYVLSRYIKALPYTGVMFFVGTLMGITAALSGHYSHISQSVALWVSIDSEVLLLVFLPGLIFKDSFGLDAHLFLYAFNQLLIFAFPLVLAGTVLGALIGYYIFPFGWSFNFAMTVGSILAATDPVAVAALLEQVGAPPRLKCHIAGESLLNDGSAIVFFSIFAERYYQEFNIEGIGQEVDVKKGIALFCQKALGGTALGIFFGLSILACLYVLNRRFSREENVVQVTAVIGIAYLNYYISDFLCKTSGVIATVAAGVVVKLLGRATINDMKLLEDFMTLVEHILNTILFTLGGAVWGAVIASGEQSGIWAAQEWGYLILLYVLLHVIRAAQFIAIYPITVRIGLSTNWPETIFQIYGGLRGALGIALGIALDNQVSKISGGTGETLAEIQSRQAVGMLGGMAFLTLVINGVTAGPLLRKLGLADVTEERLRIVKAYRLRFRAALVDEMVRLLCQSRFQQVSFALIKCHVPYLADLTKTQLMQAVDKHKSTIPPEEYVPPNLMRILPYVIDDAAGPRQQDIREMEEQLIKEMEIQQRNTRLAKRARDRQMKRCKNFSNNNLRYMMEGEFLSAQELRILFISILRSAYECQIEHGELDDAHILAATLSQSLDMALDGVAKGKPLKDWEYLNKLFQPLVGVSTRLKHIGLCLLCKKSVAKHGHLGLHAKVENMQIERSISFMAAHETAQAAFMAELQDADSELSEAAKVVLEESKMEYEKAEAAIRQYSLRTRELAISHKFCKILLTMSVHHVEKLVSLGLLREAEAEPMVEDIEEHLDNIIACSLIHHPGDNDLLPIGEWNETHPIPDGEGDDDDDNSEKDDPNLSDTVEIDSEVSKHGL